MTSDGQNSLVFLAGAFLLVPGNDSLGAWQGLLGVTCTSVGMRRDFFKTQPAKNLEYVRMLAS